MREVYLLNRCQETGPVSLLILRIKLRLFVVLPLCLSSSNKNGLSQVRSAIRRILPAELEDTMVYQVERLENMWVVEDYVEEMIRDLNRPKNVFTDLYNIDLSQKWNPKSDEGHLCYFFNELRLDFGQVLGFLRDAVSVMHGFSQNKNFFFGHSIVDFQFETAKRFIWFFPFGQRLMERDSFEKFFKRSGSIQNFIELFLRFLASGLLIFGLFAMTRVLSEKVFNWFPNLELEQSVTLYLGYGAYFFLFYRCMGAVLLLFDPFLIFTMSALGFIYLKVVFGISGMFVKLFVSLSLEKLNSFFLLINDKEFSEISREVMFKNESINKKLLVAPLMNAHVIILLFVGSLFASLKLLEEISRLVGKTLLQFSRLREVGLTALFPLKKNLRFEFRKQVGMLNFLSVY